MGERVLSTPVSGSDVSAGAAFAGGAVVLWVVVELAVRWGGVVTLDGSVGSQLGADMIVTGVGFPVLAWVIARWGRKRGIDPEDWEYDASASGVLAGIAGAVGYFGVLFGAVLIYAALVGVPEPVDAVPGSGATGEPLWVLGAFLVVNGIVVPIAEELAWRGVVQTALMSAYGALIGSTITAVAFVLKHVVVDFGVAPIRLASLVILAGVLCGVRARYGTASSTITHLAANLVGTISLLAA